MEDKKGDKGRQEETPERRRAHCAKGQIRATSVHNSGKAAAAPNSRAANKRHKTEIRRRQEGD